MGCDNSTFLFVQFPLFQWFSLNKYQKRGDPMKFFLLGKGKINLSSLQGFYLNSFNQNNQINQTSLNDFF